MVRPRDPICIVGKKVFPSFAFLRAQDHIVQEVFFGGFAVWAGWSVFCLPSFTSDNCTWEGVVQETPPQIPG